MLLNGVASAPRACRVQRRCQVCRTSAKGSDQVVEHLYSIDGGWTTQEFHDIAEQLQQSLLLDKRAGEAFDTMSYPSMQDGESAQLWTDDAEFIASSSEGIFFETDEDQVCAFRHVGALRLLCCCCPAQVHGRRTQSSSQAARRAPWTGAKQAMCSVNIYEHREGNSLGKSEHLSCKLILFSSAVTFAALHPTDACTDRKSMVPVWCNFYSCVGRLERDRFEFRC